MRYKIKGQEKNDEHELILELRLRGGEVIIVAKDRTGFIWHLLELRPDGTFRRCTSLPDYIGLQVTDDGEMVETIE